ncbi:MAG: ribosome maturation factor RimP [Bacilli bacterium]
MKSLPHIVETIVDDEANRLHLVVEDLIWETIHHQYYLRVIADSAAGLSIDEASALNEAISLRLDEMDPIDVEYILEVSSPGLERPLKKKEDFLRFMDSYIYVKTYLALDGQKEFYGTLSSYDEDGIDVLYQDKTKQKSIKILHQQISMVRLAVKF